MAKDKPKKSASTSESGSRQGKPPKKVELQLPTGSNSKIWQDERFQHLVSDPRFKGIPKVQRKVKIDKRFQSMFTDDKFKVTYTVDKYGRRVNKSNADDLRKFYELDSEEGEEDDEALEQEKEEKAIIGDSEDSGESTPSEEEAGENDALSSDDEGAGEDVPEKLKKRLLDPNIDYARGEGRLVTDSSDDESSTDKEDDPEMYIEHVWGELDVDTEKTDESTHRLAVCNMDWDRIRAVDLMVLLCSFLPPGGSVLSVKIYPSEFGKERMAEEEQHGPTELKGLGKKVEGRGKSSTKKATSDDSSDESDEDLVQEQDSDAEEGDEYHMEKLRQYQLNRLRYYYAVVECDSVNTADKIYKECDGIEYESSATRVDLRFIPDDTTFADEEPSDVCNELPESNSYKPRTFTTTALQQAKVDLTWDETAVERQELGDRLASGKLEDVSDKDLRKIIAYSSEDDVSASENEAQLSSDTTAKNVHTKDDGNKRKVKKKEYVINKYKALLAEINEKEQKGKEEKKYEMEFSWNVTDSKATNDDKDLNDDKQVSSSSQLTPIEKILQKRSEKNKKRKEEHKRKKLLAKGVDPDDANDDSDLDSLPDGVDLNDPYFAEEFANGDYVEPKAKKKEKEKLARQQKKLEKLKQEEEEERHAKELQLLLDDDDLEDRGKQHFSLEKILKSQDEKKLKRKRRKQLKKSKSAIAGENKETEDTFQINLKDERFKAIYSLPQFNIDPTDSHFKRTKAMDQIIEEKLKRRHNDDVEGNTGVPDMPEEKRSKQHLENKLLVKNLKRKIQVTQKKAKK